MIHISMKMMTLYKIIRSMPCFFKEVTHFYCPACGGTRSVIALLHLDIERAFLCNPTVVYTGVMFLWCIAGWMVKKLTAREMKTINKLTESKQILIRFSEVDSMSIVWHGSYVQYFEDAREAFGRKY